MGKKLDCLKYGGRGKKLKVPYYTSAVAARNGNVPYVKATCLTSKQYALNNGHLPLFLTNIITTRLIKYTVAVVSNTVKGIININYKVIIKALIKIYFKITAKKNAIFIKR